MAKKNNVTYIAEQPKEDTPACLLDDLPGNARGSFKKSLENAVFSQVTQLEFDEISEILVDETFINNVLIHMKNKAKYGPVWSKYVFEVPDETFKQMLLKNIENLNNKNVPDSFIWDYKRLAKDLNEADWLPAPENYLLFLKKYDLLAEAHEKMLEERRKETEKEQAQTNIVPMRRVQKRK